MTKRKKIVAVTISILLVGAVAVFVFRDSLLPLAFRPTDSNIPEGVRSSANEEDIEKISTIATDLQTPWGIVQLPDGDLLVTERPGTVVRIGTDSTSYPVSGVVETSEGGLLGIALHPEFTENQFVYLYSTYRSDGQLLNRVERYTYSDGVLERERTIIAGIPGASTHDGGALAFGPDGKLYITTGDAGNPAAAQDTSSLAGKILRLNDDGTRPPDNPFGNAVYSYGHRNPQGIAWDSSGRMWSAEHGPSGLNTGRDELNLIEPGANYGWPAITGDETHAGMRSPIVQSGDSDTWAPGALTYHNGSLFFTGLRGQTLYEATLQDDGSVSLTRHFSRDYGRLRAVLATTEGLYVSTSNTDGRGSPQPNDDRILRFSFDLFAN